MVTPVARSEIPGFKVKIKSSLWLLLVTHWLLVTMNHSQALVLKKSSVFRRMTLIGHAHSSQYMEWHHLGFISHKHAIYFPKVA